MICRACLRAQGAFAKGLPAQKLLQASRTQTRQLSAAISTRFLSIPSLPRAQPLHKLVARQFSTSFPTASASAQPQETTPPSASTPEKPTYLSDGESQVWDLLLAEFAPTELVVQDISGGCGSMYGIEVCSEKFRGLNMLRQQRLVNAALGDLMKEWHGVQLKTRVP